MLPPAHAAHPTTSPDLVLVRRALLSVSDKTALVEFARSLAALDVELVSTGGTAKALRDAGLRVLDVAEVTGAPEMMDGRVKTLHPKVHGGLLAVRDLPDHARALRDHAITPIDLLVVNLYPFEATVAQPGAARAAAIENIDIGGPAMIRSAAKNHAYVGVVTDASQYPRVLAEIAAHRGHTTRALREDLALAAFARTSAYDAAIAAYLRSETPSPRPQTAPPPTPPPAPAAQWPMRLARSFDLAQSLRYGDNPHQRAAVYRDAPPAPGPSVLSARQLHGKELSYNNLADADAALDLALALAGPALPSVGACVIKHANPCGAAVAGTPLAAVSDALAGDPLAAFGGILACSAAIDDETARRLAAKGTFLEVIIARGFTPGALDILRARSEGLRLLAVEGALEHHDPAPAAALQFRSIRGGLLVQESDALAPDPASWRHVAGPAPSPAALRSAAAIEIMARAMHSNAIAIGQPTESGAMLVGGGLGQVDRVTACRLAIEKAGPRAKHAIAVSDAFFPFPDGPQTLIDAGVAMIVHPGGSKRDQETIDLCAQHRVTCMLTGVRRFRH